MARRSLPPLSHPFGTLTLMKKRPTLHSTGVHRLPEGPASWQIDDATRQLALAGIAQARAALAAALASHSPEPTTLELHEHPAAA
ncbi:unannotated protein [freshwater metagenome]|jgi:hypothetical protein|uniref:Unannotated protein n=2 Tax=freshwater metagenome TaxID=449393 RepID=A0A6J6EA36_9ZZZZ